MFDIMEKRITLVENLAKSRQPFPEMDVIYFITPTIQSIRLFISDFEVPGKHKYGNVNVIFTDTVSYRDCYIYSSIMLIDDCVSLRSVVKVLL